MKWFQVDSDTPHDPKIEAVLDELGPEGVGGLFLLWCHIANHGAKPGRSLQTSRQPIPEQELRRASHLADAIFDRLVAICARSGHFVASAWDARREIILPAMRRRADTYTKRRVRTHGEHGSKSVRRKSPTVQDSTVHTKVPPNPPAPAALGGRFTRKELAFARKVRDQRFGCPHEPRCASVETCVRLIAAEIREKYA